MTTDINITSYENNIRDLMLDSYFNELQTKFEKEVAQHTETSVRVGAEESLKGSSGSFPIVGN